MGEAVTELSIIIPARNEMFLARTVEDILENIRADTEIIVVLDGAWADPPLVQNDRVHVVYLHKSIGQRAATNMAAKLARGKYVMKLDAHCSFAPGFDEIMLADMEPDITMVPVMRNLHAFDWVCECGERTYQGPSNFECKKCGSDKHTKDTVWTGKKSPQSTAYRFTPDLEFKYWGKYKKQQSGDLVESMSLQGSCFMVSRERYFELNLCDETLGSWGGQGSEVALKSWLSGGRVLVNKKTWYAHLFRTQGGDFGFPYPNPGNEQKRAKDKLREMFLNDRWDGAIHPLSWLIEKFASVPEWHDSVPNPDTTPTKGIVYYTDNKLTSDIMEACQRQIVNAANGRKVISVSLDPLEFGENITLDLERGYLTMFKQILTGLDKLETDIVYLCEHDVLYHPSHFEFTPAKRDVFYYNENVWKVHRDFGFALFYYCKQTSGLCAYRDTLIDHYRKRVAYVEKHGFSQRIGFEPGTHGRIPELAGKSDRWMSEYPNIDIRHNENLTPSRWKKSQFRNQRFCKGWLMKDTVPGWGKTLGRFDEIMESIK